jgi:hypothetical protein
MDVNFAGARSAIDFHAFCTTDAQRRQYAENRHAMHLLLSLKRENEKARQLKSGLEDQWRKSHPRRFAGH